MYVWNYDQDSRNNRGTRGVNLGTQDAAGSLGGAYTFQVATEFNIAPADGTTETSSQFIDLSSLSLSGVRFIELDILTNWGDGSGETGGVGFTGLGEVRFVGEAAVVPEPSALFLVGCTSLAGFGLAYRRRRQR